MNEGCSTMPWCCSAAAQQVSPLLLRMRGVTFTLTGPSGPSKLHCSPVESSV